MTSYFSSSGIPFLALVELNLTICVVVFDDFVYSGFLVCLSQFETCGPCSLMPIVATLYGLIQYMGMLPVVYALLVEASHVFALSWLSLAGPV
jgi:hypothetical protein